MRNEELNYLIKQYVNFLYLTKYYKTFTLRIMKNLYLTLKYPQSFIKIEQVDILFGVNSVIFLIIYYFYFLIHH